MITDDEVFRIVGDSPQFLCFECVDVYRIKIVIIYDYNNKSNINIYSLAYPPLKIEDTLQTVAGHKALVTKTGFFIGIGICIIAGMGCMYLCYRKKKRRRKESHIPHNPPVVTNTDRSSKTTTQDENYKPKM